MDISFSYLRDAVSKSRQLRAARIAGMAALPMVCQGAPSPAGLGPAPLPPGAFPGLVSGGQLLEEVVAIHFQVQRREGKLRGRSGDCLDFTQYPVTCSRGSVYFCCRQDFVAN